MKEYKIKEGNYFFLSKCYKYYVMNGEYHGIYFSLSYVTRKTLYKGKYNVNLQYSHWVDNGNCFYYSL